ncbi:P-II family nitrogen regulator [Kyrpidia spormannii]|uniref:Nitrogen regulatory protein P-II (Modular protein) n=2 Tax=Kyrpidia spormannii TaxID=2055160 RepID=A0A6F9E747_9BACL|nr:Nitrogen regulatory protein P-II (modular protein) [Kyrpidia spormannii]
MEREQGERDLSSPAPFVIMGAIKAIFRREGRMGLKKIEAIIRPEKLQAVIAKLHAAGIFGFTVSQVQGRGQQRSSAGVYRGHVYQISLHPKVKVEMVVSDAYAQRAVESIVQAAQTGEAGDGKIFVLPVYEAYNIRTGAPDETIDDMRSTK